jgi:hypothetical protein
MPAQRVAAPKRVVVVGAGMAGLQAAVGAAERGHRVTLLGTTLGGGAALHARLPGCGDIARAVAHLAARAEAAGVAMRLGAPADAAAVLALAPEAVVLATGAAMAAPPGLDPASDLRSIAAALLAEPARRGRRALVYDLDATPMTYDATELLAARYAEVLVATPRDAIARDTPLLVAQGILTRLAACGVRILACRDVVGFDRGVATLRHALTGAEERIEGLDLVTHAGARVPRDALAATLREAGITVRAVGDALAPRLMLSAVREGQAAADSI